MPNISSLHVSAYRPVILVAPLDWGLGHITRSIPLIRILKNIGCEVITGGSEDAATIFGAEFPGTEHLWLPSYRIRYGHGNNALGWQFLGRMPKILTGIKQENAILADFVAARKPDGILSDNRFGCFHPGVPSVFITHQLAIRTPFGAWGNAWARRMNYRFIRSFQQVWIPDNEEAPGLAGALSHPSQKPPLPMQYGGPLTRLHRQPSSDRYDLLFLLSGPEPQRSLFEQLLREQAPATGKRALMIRGLPGGSREVRKEGSLDVLDYAGSETLSSCIAGSGTIVARSGYTTVMDLSALGKKALLVPTPGQTEQEYLSEHLLRTGRFFSVPQRELRLTDALEKAAAFYRNGTDHPPVLSRWEELLHNWVRHLPHARK